MDVEQLGRRESPAELDFAAAGGGELVRDGLLRIDRARGVHGRFDKFTGYLDVSLDFGQIQPRLEKLHLETELPKDVLAAFLGSPLDFTVSREGPGLHSGVGLFEVCQPGLVEFGLKFRALLNGLREHLVIGVAGFDLLVDDDLVETFVLTENLMGEGELVWKGEPAGEEETLGAELGILDGLTGLDFLFACEQGLVAHLLQVDVERIVRGVGRFGACGFRFGLRELLPVFLDFVLVEEFDVEAVEGIHDKLDQLRVGGAVGNDIVDILDRDIAVLLRKADEMLDLRVDVRSGGRGRDERGQGGERFRGDFGVFHESG